MIDLESIHGYYSLFLRVNFDSTINTCYINKICLFDGFGIYSWVPMYFLVLFMGFTVLFQLTFIFIYRTFSKKNFSFNKISGSQIDLNNIIPNNYVYHAFIYFKEKVWPFVWIILGSTYHKSEERRDDSMFKQNEIQQTSRKRTCPGLKIWLSSRKLFANERVLLELLKMTQFW